MEYEKEYNDLIARINAVKNTPKIGMKGKHHYDGYVETGIRDALNYILNPESEDERIRKDIMVAVENSGLPYERIEEIRFYLNNQKEQKPAEWSEEDERRYISCLQRLGTGNPNQPETINSKWFKEHCYPQQKVELNDEDKTRFMSCLLKLRTNEGVDTKNSRWFETRFASLCTQPHWKPSEEQMEALGAIVGMIHPLDKRYDAIFGLLKELKAF